MLLWPVILIDRIYHHVLFVISSHHAFDRFTLYSVDHDTTFFERVEAALALLKDVDPRRYRRAQRYLPVIALVKQGRNFYKHTARAFYVDECPDDVPYFASEIVHEATHAYLRHRGFRYTKSDRERHEHICTAEQLAFITRAIRSQSHVPEPQQQELIARWNRWFEEHLASKWWEDREVRRLQFTAVKRVIQDFLSSLRPRKPEKEK